MENATQDIIRQRRYRSRLREQGNTQILLKLPLEIVEALDRLREVQGVSSRGDVVVSLVQQLQEANNELKSA
jgi:metal-responsive CopG/Arc/MetJ family transcriptional regulator